MHARVITLTLPSPSHMSIQKFTSIGWEREEIEEVRGYGPAPPRKNLPAPLKMANQTLINGAGRGSRGGVGWLPGLTWLQPAAEKKTYSWKVGGMGNAIK
jgi:hypothetical protein